MKIVKLLKKDNASKSTPDATSNMTFKNPFLRGEDARYVYQNVLKTRSLHPSLVVSGNDQPGLSISIDRQVNPIIKELKINTKDYQQGKPRNLKLSRPRMATSLKKQWPRKFS